jgi:RimJ/RimL family protein N-acetyltransferase
MYFLTKGESVIEIAPVSPAHVEGFHRALDSVARERKYLAVLEAFPVNQMRDFVLNQIKTSSPAFVALAGVEIVGRCDIRRSPFATYAHRGSVGMGVVAEHRGRGIGFRLLSAALEDAFRRGLERVELDVRVDNVRAIALYEKIGFTREGLIRDAFLVDGEYCDALSMAMIRRRLADNR